MITKRVPWLVGMVMLAALTVAIASCGDASPSEAPTATDIETAAPTPTADQSIDLSGLVITMTRGACFGFCPVYTITIREDGSVTYEGHSDVDVKGTDHTQVEIDEVRRLVQQFDEIGFFDIPEDSDCPVSDIPRTITSVKLGDRNHSVLHCSLADSPSSILGLIDIEDQIDRITNSRQWTDIPDKVIVMRGVRYPTPDEEGCSSLPCTTYRLVLYEDGRVEYEGVQNVNVIGTRNGQVTDEEVDSLLSAFVENGFFDLAPDFRCQARDLDATTTAVFLHTRGSVHTRSNVVERCHVPEPDNRLESLHQLQLKIAELVGLEQWVGEENLP